MVTDATTVTIHYPDLSATKVVLMVVCPDVGWDNFTISCRAFINSTIIYLKKISANTGTGVISGAAVDFTNLSNAPAVSSSFYVLGVLKLY